MPVAISSPILPFNSVLPVGLTAVLPMRMELQADPTVGLEAPEGAVDLEVAEAAEVDSLAVAEEDVEVAAVAEEVSGATGSVRADGIFRLSSEIAAGAASNKSKGKRFLRFAIQPSMRGPIL